MGCNNSSGNVSAAGRQVNAAIDKGMAGFQRSDQNRKKLLLLGTGSSGKSTIFQTLAAVVEDNITNGERPARPDDDVLRVIRMNCVSGMLLLLKKSQELSDSAPQQHAPCFVAMNEEIIFAVRELAKPEYGEESYFSELSKDTLSKIGTSIDLLWRLQAIRETFHRRGSLYCYPDNMDYYFGKIGELFRYDYRMTFEDKIKVRIKTTGMQYYSYEIKENEFVVYDVGGQRNERKKWIHQFAEVAAVIFVTALNHYNAVLFEDERKNAMHEAIELFENISNSRWFKKSEFILFLNKDDLFRDKLRRQIPLSVCFTSDVGWHGQQWQGDECRDYAPIAHDDVADNDEYMRCYEAAKNFIKDRFTEVNEVPDRLIFTHFICATDTDTIQKVFWDVQNTVIRSNLRKGGLIV